MESWEYARLLTTFDAVGQITGAFFLHFGVSAGAGERLGPQLPDSAIARWSNQPGAPASDERAAITKAWQDRVAELGRDGWELFAVNGNAYMFKRRTLSDI